MPAVSPAPPVPPLHPVHPQNDFPASHNGGADHPDIEPPGNDSPYDESPDNEAPEEEPPQNPTLQHPSPGGVPFWDPPTKNTVNAWPSEVAAVYNWLFGTSNVT
jgi:hypothetical protein